MHDIVVFVVTLRENDDAVPFLKQVNGITEGRNQPCIVVNGNGIGIVEQQQGKRCNQVTEQSVKPAYGCRLL